MLDVNTSYFLFGGQGVLCFLLTFYFWLNNQQLPGSKALLGYGLCLSLESLSYSFLSPYNINVATCISNIIAFTTVLFLKEALVKLLKIEQRVHIFKPFYFIAVFTSLIFYFNDLSDQLRISTLGGIFTFMYMLLIYLLSKNKVLHYPKQVHFLAFCLFINLIGNLVITLTEASAIKDTVYFSTDAEIILVGIMLSSSIAIVIGLISTIAEHREQSLIALSASKSEFITNVSHEIRTPMNGVLGMLSLLDSSALDDSQKHKVSIARSSANSLLAIINEVLDFSKIESGKLALDIVDVDINSLVEQTVHNFALQAHQKGIELVLDSDDFSKSYFVTDPSKLQQIFTNLIGNALKFTQHGEVRIEVRKIDKNKNMLYLQGKVFDTGIGIKKETLATLFDSFTQADSSTTRKYGGTGIGLSITKSLCQLLGGEISVESEFGQGSCFTFTLPIKLSKPKCNDPPSINVNASNAILIDNNHYSANVTKKLLNQFNFTVTSLDAEQHPIEFIASIANQFTEDVILIDESLITTDLNAFITTVNQLYPNNPPKVILLAHLDTVHIEQDIYDNGVAQIIYKPITRQSLYSSLIRLMNEQNKQANIDEFIGENSTDDPLVGRVKFNNKHVLLVEDNRVNQMVALGVLQQLGLKATVANNGEEALAILTNKNTQFELVLMDCLMPEMDGYEATKRIRAGEAGSNYSNIPVIALTANVLDKDIEQCMLSGMNDVLTKPIKPDEIYQTLAKFVQ